MTNSDDMPFGCAVLILGAILVWAIVYSIWVPQTNRTVTATVTKTWTQCTHDECTHLIGTTAGVFEDSDSALYWKWNSSDYFNQMDVGMTCTFHVVGWRNTFASVYPNIVQLDSCTGAAKSGQQ